MKAKNLLLTFVFLGSLTITINAQTQPPNGGFETWTSNVIENPDGFFTSNANLSSSNPNVTKVTDSYHNSFAAKLETVLSGTSTIQGMLLIGTPGNQTINGGFPYTGTPDSVSGYIKYDIQPNDTAYFIIAFKKNGGFIGQVVATFYGTQSSYVRFVVPTYLNALNPPDSLVAIITSSNMDPPQIVGSTMTIDSISFTNTSQPFPNGDFENWTAINTGANPDSWSSFNNFYNFGIPEMSFETNDANSGTSALRIISLTATIPPPFGTNTLDTLSGYVFLGSPNMDYPGIAYTERPLLMQAYVKGTVNAGSEVYIFASLTKWNTTTQVRDQVATAMYYSSSSIASYTQISVPFNYDLQITPDTLDIKIMAGNVGPGGFIMPGNEFFVDDIGFTFPVNIDLTSNNNSNINIYPNPAKDKITVSSLESIDSIEVYNMLGEIVYSINNLKQQFYNEINLSAFEKGIYFVKIKEGENTQTKKIVKQ